MAGTPEETLGSAAGQSSATEDGASNNGSTSVDGHHSSKADRQGSNGSSSGNGISDMPLQQAQQQASSNSGNTAIADAHASGSHGGDDRDAKPGQGGPSSAAHDAHTADQNDAAEQSYEAAKHKDNKQDDTPVPSHESALEDQQHPSGVPGNWNASSVLQFLHEHSAMSSKEVGKRVQVPDDFSPISQSEEDSLIIAACRHSNMLSLFWAYAAHDVLTFISFARLYCCQLQTT